MLIFLVIYFYSLFFLLLLLLLFIFQTLRIAYAEQYYWSRTRESRDRNKVIDTDWSWREKKLLLKTFFSFVLFCHHHHHRQRLWIFFSLYATAKTKTNPFDVLAFLNVHFLSTVLFAYRKTFWPSDDLFAFWLLFEPSLSRKVIDKVLEPSWNTNALKIYAFNLFWSSCFLSNVNWFSSEM